MQVLIDVVFAGAFFFSASSPLSSANATLFAILLLCLVGVTGSAFGVLGFGVAFGLDSGLIAGLLGFAFLPGLLPLERLRAGRLVA